MFPKTYQKKIFKHRFFIFCLVTALFIAAFVINILMNKALYNFNLNQVPIWQQDPVWGNKSFIAFMNVISNIFNPIICAGYILIFFLISYRKLEILVFLVWFIFLSWILSLLKLIFHQARPYWIAGSGVQMLQWTCYTEFGMPSGHSMMSIILIEFVIRFYARVNKYVSRYAAFFYFLMVIFNILVMFSRVILGMHSLNQVLFGCMLGCYTFVPYYLFVQRHLLKWILAIFRSPKSPFTIIILMCLSLISLSISLLISLLIPYKNTVYINVINGIQGCSKYKQFKSFQYKCLEDTAIFMAAVGILLAFNLMRNPSHLNLQLDYTRLSFRYVAKFLVTLLIPLAVLVIFVNPLWYKIPVDVESMGLIIWGCQVAGFFMATFVLIYIIPLVNRKFGFEIYRMPESYEDFKKYQLISQSTDTRTNQPIEKKPNQLKIIPISQISKEQVQETLEDINVSKSYETHQKDLLDNQPDNRKQRNSQGYIR